MSTEPIMGDWKIKVSLGVSRSYEPKHDKTSKMICVSSEDSYQPGHPPGLIRVFTVHLKRVGSLVTHKAHNETS